MKKGFTLMEILFVLLVIALIISFAVPAFRAVRYDVKNARAQAALKKLAEARRSFYQYSKGSDIDSTAGNRAFNPDAAQNYAAGPCQSAASSGIPGSSSGSAAVSQLFACGFLNWKDFAGLPYTFYICPPRTAAPAPCVVPAGKLNAGSFTYAGAVAKSKQEAGAKYGDTYYMYVGPDMQVGDTLE